MNKQCILIGAGGHAKVLAEILQHSGTKIDFIVAPNLDKNPSIFSGIKKLKDDDEIIRLNPNKVVLINGVGSLPGKHNRKNIFEKFNSKGFKFMSIISSQAMVSANCVLSEGVQIMPGAILNADVFIGENTLVNSGAIIEHDCKVGSHNHIAPGAVLCGTVSTGSGVHVGAGANIIQLIDIGDFSVVGAGITLTENLESQKVVYSDRLLKIKDFI